MNTENTIYTDGIIFDLDGTLWDASASTAVAWTNALSDAGFSEHVMKEETVRSVSGLRVERILDEVFHFIPKERHQDLLDAYRKQQAAVLKKRGGILYPAVRKVLEDYRGMIKLIIVSNCMVGYIENFLSFCEVKHLIDDFESSGNTGKAKDENIKLVVQRNGLKAPVYVGDTVWDREASDASGTPFIFAAYGFGQINDAVYHIETFDELSGLVKPLSELKTNDR